MKPKDAHKLDIAKPHKSEIYPDENVPPEDYTDTDISLASNMEIKRDRLLTLSEVKTGIG